MSSLYLHIPFCEHKCVYCDFYSIENLRGIGAFSAALEKEIEFHAELRLTENFETIFFGGGTPSLLTPAQLERILAKLRSVFSLSSDSEVTVETNPGTVDARKLSDYRALGVNRLSVGIQSFHEDELRFLTRIHSAQQAKDCVLAARRVGFDNINVDLIFALPGQTMERWQSNVLQALELQPEHVSAYSLIVEPGTPLARMVAAKQVQPLPSEDDAEMFAWTMEVLQGAGYEHYEVSNYAKPGFRSRHNSNYWNHTNYLGFGPSAHSFWRTSPSSARRWWNIANLSTYTAKISTGLRPVAGDEYLRRDELFAEAVMLGLRSGGIDLANVRRTFGVDLFAEAGSIIADVTESGHATVKDGTLLLTEEGFLLCDEIANRMLALCGQSRVAV